MAKRSGLSEAIGISRAFCKLYAVWQPSMFAAIDASPVGTSEQKADAKEALTHIAHACDALELFRKIYES